MLGFDIRSSIPKVLTMRIDIISDTICPWCYVGKRHLETALAARPDVVAELYWHPFELHPDMPVEGMDSRDFYETKFGSQERMEEVLSNVEGAGRAAGIHFAYDRIDRVPNTVRSHALIRWASRFGEQTAAAEALFHAYFIEGRDIGDVQVLTDVAEDLGLPADEAVTWITGEESLTAVRRVAMQIKQMGIDGVPCYVIAEKYAVVGAQPPEAFVAILDKAMAQEAE